MNLSEFRNQVIELENSGGPFVTVSLDLEAVAGGRPQAETVFRKAFAHAIEEAPEAAKELEARQAAVDGAIEEAIADGAVGLLVVATEERLLALETQLPFRNHVRIGDSPWRFELERQLYLLGRGVVAVDVSRSEVKIVRIADAEVENVEDVDRDEHSTRTVHGRTNVEGHGGGMGMPGGHSRNRIQNRVAEHRAQEAREAADTLQSLWQTGDIVVVAGSTEPRHELVNELSPELVEAIVEDVKEIPGEERGLIELAARISRAAQLAAADRLADAILTGGAGETIARGRTGVEGALAAGRAGQLVLHEDVVGHWGTAEDARQHVPPHDDAPYEAMLEQALGSSAEVLFGTLPALLEQYEGVAATTRW